MKHMNRHYFPHVLAGALALACMNPAIAYEPTSHYTEKDMHGWNVFVNNALLPGCITLECYTLPSINFHQHLKENLHSWFLRQ